MFLHISLLFNHQVQLVDTLEKTKAQSKPAQLKTLSVPLVHDGRKQMGESLLSERQIQWLESMPNDRNTQNPVLYR